MSGVDPVDKVHQPIMRRYTISCLCRAVLGKHGRNPAGEVFAPMSWPEARKWKDIYNNPENHYAPFTDEDKIR